MDEQFSRVQRAAVSAHRSYEDIVRLYLQKARSGETVRAEHIMRDLLAFLGVPTHKRFGETATFRWSDSAVASMPPSILRREMKLAEDSVLVSGTGGDLRFFYWEIVVPKGCFWRPGRLIPIRLTASVDHRPGADVSENRYIAPERQSNLVTAVTGFWRLTCEQVRLAGRLAAIDICRWNDRHGRYADEDLERSGVPVMEHDEAVKLASEILRDHMGVTEWLKQS